MTTAAKQQHLAMMLKGLELRPNETTKFVLDSDDVSTLILALESEGKHNIVVHSLSLRVAKAKAAQKAAEDALEKQKFDLLDANPQWGETNERLATRIGELAENLSNAYKRVDEANKRAVDAGAAILGYQQAHLEMNNKLKQDKAHTSAMGRQNQAFTNKLKVLTTQMSTQAHKFSVAMDGKDKIIDALLQEKLKLQVSFGTDEIVLDTETFADKNTKLNLTYNEPELKENEENDDEQS